MTPKNEREQQTAVATAAEAASLADIQRRGTRIRAWPVAAVLIMLVAGPLLRERSVIVFFVLAAVFFALTGRHQFARCPRCRQYFNWSEKRRYTFADACVNCGLELTARPQGP